MPLGMGEGWHHPYPRAFPTLPNFPVIWTGRHIGLLMQVKLGRVQNALGYGGGVAPPLPTGISYSPQFPKVVGIVKPILLPPGAGITWKGQECLNRRSIWA